MGPYQPYQGYQPYQPYQTYQPYQGQPRQGVTGRVVNSPSDIQVQEVPTDGSMALFPAADGSCVYGKKWTADGSITTQRFVPEAADGSQDPLQTINDRLGELFALVEDISDSIPREVKTQPKRRAVKADA